MNTQKNYQNKINNYKNLDKKNRYCKVIPIILKFDKILGWMILLVKDGISDYNFENSWYIPNGYVKTDETLQMACSRECLSNTTLDIDSKKFKLLNILSNSEKYKTDDVILSFYTIVDSNIEVDTDLIFKYNKNVDFVSWFALEVANNIPIIKEQKEIINYLYNNISNMSLALENNISEAYIVLD